VPTCPAEKKENARRSRRISGRKNSEETGTRKNDIIRASWNLFGIQNPEGFFPGLMRLPVTLVCRQTVKTMSFYGLFFYFLL
jgi:hypothetical protein